MAYLDVHITWSTWSTSELIHTIDTGLANNSFKIYDSPIVNSYVKLICMFYRFYKVSGGVCGKGGNCFEYW